MPITLIATLGNRDLQLAANSDCPVRLFEYFDRAGIDTGDNLIVKKANMEFLNNSQRIWENYDSLKSRVVFPMVEQYLQLLEQKPEHIVLVSTQQDPLDVQDCYFIGLFLQRTLEEQGYAVTFKPINCSPVDFSALLRVFSELYNEYPDQQLVVGNSGGTPDMRAASYAAGFFRNVQYITLQARGGTASKTNFEAQEKVVLKHIVEKMVASFDYAGLLNLPISDERFKNLAHYAIARLALDFSRADRLARQLKAEDLTIGPATDLATKEREVWISAKIKFHQKAWGDFLWRIFLIQENLYTPFIEEYLDGKIIYNEKEWSKLLKKEPDLVEYLSTRTINSKPLDFSKPGKIVYDQIIKYIQENSDLNDTVNFKRSAKIDHILRNSLRELRNGVAHNYSGTSQEQIQDALQKNARSNLEELFELLGKKTGVQANGFGVYEYLNDQILRCL